MVQWPDTAELKQVLDITSEDWDDTLDRVMASAIDTTKEMIVGTVTAYDARYTEPTDKHAQAALRMAELIATRPEATPGQDPTIRRLLFGQRRRFGVA